jgi:uncharacterized membrane protein
MTGTVTVSLLVLILLGATLFLLPYFTQRRFFFTITVAPGFPASAAGRSITRAYHVQIAVTLALSLLAVFAFSNAAMVWAELLLALGGAAAFLYARSKVSRYSLTPEAVHEVDLDAIEEHLPRWILWALPPFLFPPAAAAWLHAHWSEIPVRFPYHWNARGEPDSWTIKSERAVYGPLLFCAGIMLLVLLMSIATFYGSRRAEQRLATLKIVIAVMYFVAIVCTIVSLMPVVQIPWWLLLVLTALFLIGTLGWSYRFISAPGRDAEATPDACWHLGQIYYNPQDAAIFVQKRLGLGYTVNFGNRMSWVLVGVFVLAIGGMVFLLPRSD